PPSRNAGSHSRQHRPPRRRSLGGHRRSGDPRRGRTWPSGPHRVHPMTRNGAEAEHQVIPGVVNYSGPLKELIDERFKHVLSLTSEPKDLVKALEAATAWLKVKADLDGDQGYGTKLKGAGDGQR